MTICRTSGHYNKGRDSSARYRPTAVEADLWRLNFGFHACWGAIIKQSGLLSVVEDWEEATIPKGIGLRWLWVDG